MSAGTVNKVILIGNLGRDPEIRTTKDGREIANIIIASSEHWTDRTSGERRERTEWHRVVIFNPNLVKLLKEYVKKGTKVYVEGQLHTRKWQDAQTGQDRYATEVVVQGYNGSISFLSKANDSRQSARDSANEYAAATRAQYQASNDTDLDDEIPF